MEEKLYFIVDAEKPGDDSTVKIEGADLFSKEVADKFIAENQVDLAEPVELEPGVIITKKYNLFEAPETPKVEL